MRPFSPSYPFALLTIPCIDHVQMTALSKALHVNLNVAYLDGRNSTGVVDFVEFENGDNSSESVKPIVLLYRPGHYDVLLSGDKK